MIIPEKGHHWSQFHDKWYFCLSMQEFNSINLHILYNTTKRKMLDHNLLVRAKPLWVIDYISLVVAPTLTPLFLELGSKPAVSFFTVNFHPYLSHHYELKWKWLASCSKSLLTCLYGFSFCAFVPHSLAFLRIFLKMYVSPWLI